MSHSQEKQSSTKVASSVAKPILYLSIFALCVASFDGRRTDGKITERITE